MLVINIIKFSSNSFLKTVARLGKVTYIKLFLPYLALSHFLPTQTSFPILMPVA